MARGYRPKAPDVKPATPIHWSAKSGNASIAPRPTKLAGFPLSSRPRVEHNISRRHSRHHASDTAGSRRKQALRSDGHHTRTDAPRAASFVLLFLIVAHRRSLEQYLFVGDDRYWERRAASHRTSPDRSHRRSSAHRRVNSCTSTFLFGSDFYQPNASLILTTNGTELSRLGPPGDIAPDPMARDHFIDHYWRTSSSSATPRAWLLSRIRPIQGKIVTPNDLPR
jgi:hypothetical protein